MRIHNGDVWHLQDKNNWIGVTTNHTIRNKRNVMGGGVALEAARKFPKLPEEFANLILTLPDLNVFPFPEYNIFTFRTKEEVWVDSDLKTIEKSCSQLKKAMLLNTDLNFYLPAPGCGLGGLTWKEVEPILKKYFDDTDRLIVCFK